MTYFTAAVRTLKLQVVNPSYLEKLSNWYNLSACKCNEIHARISALC